VIDRSRSALPLRSVLRAIRLSPSRYHHWNPEQQCALDDSPSCPRLSPQQLTAAEVEAIQDLVTSQEYRHVPTGFLALLAQRIGKVFASASTWYRLIRDLTGQDFGPKPGDRAVDVVSARKKWQAWWEKEGAK